MIILRDMTLRIAGKVLLNQVNLTLHSQYHYGLVGRNGSGKSTLFRALLGEIHPEEGQVLLNKNLRIGYVAQEVPDGTITPIEIVLAADRERVQLMVEFEASEDPLKLAEIQERLLAIEAFSAESRAATVLDGLGFDQAAQHRPISEFSGGWRMRVALAAALFEAPDLLLLDEPTNYLDLESTLWLEKYLKVYPKALIIISHERHLLDAACDHILFLHDQKLSCYSGNYETFTQTWELQQEHLKAQHTKQEAARKHMQSFIDRFGKKATKARQAQSRLKAIERLAKLPDIYKEPEVHFDFPESENLSPPIVVLDDVNGGYVPQRPILRQISLRIDSDNRIAFLGENGNGKSTLAKLIAGRLAPQEGEIVRSRKLRIGYFAQHQIDEFNPSQSAFEHLREKLPGYVPAQVRAYLGRFGLSGHKADTAAGKLSGGEKARLNLALICVDKPHLLILDEPTNHLDMASREALTKALNQYSGAVLLIAHDWSFLEATMDQFYLVADGSVTPFEGDLEDYKRYILNKRSGKLKGAKKERPIFSSNQYKDLQRKEKLAYQEVEILQKEIARLAEELSLPNAYQQPVYPDLLKRLQACEVSLKEAEEAWIKAAQELERSAPLSD